MSPSGNLSQFALPCHPSTPPSWCRASDRQPRTARTAGLSGYLVWLGAQKHLCFSLLCPGFKMRTHCGKPQASFPQQADGSFDFKGYPRTPSYQRPFLVIIQSQVQLPKLPASLRRNKEVYCNLLCSVSVFCLFILTSKSQEDTVLSKAFSSAQQ